MRALLALFLLLSLLGCPQSKSPTGAPGERARKEKRAQAAEVEFFGKWEAGEVKAAKVVFVAQAEPCTPVPEQPTRFGEQAMEKPGPLFAEFFIPQGTKGHGCLYGLDEAGKVVGVAGSDQNPMTFQGEGEVVFGKLDYVLRAP